MSIGSVCQRCKRAYTRLPQTALLTVLIVLTACQLQLRTHLPSISANFAPESPLSDGQLVSDQQHAQALYLPQIARVPSTTVTARTQHVISLPPAGKFGVDPLHPIDIRSGTRSVIAANPEIIAGTGADWVRLNFVLGPWTSIHDGTHYHGQGWADTYRSIIDGYRSQGLHIYALISYEAMPTDPGDSLRSRPPIDGTEHEWVDGYVETVLAVLDQFAHEIEVVETLNEPDDWHGGRGAWVHPAWQAIIHQRIYPSLKANPRTEQITLVTGPLQGLQNNHNRAADYLFMFYTEGKARFGWGEEDHPYPFDGIGYHLYMHDRFYYDAEQHDRALRSVYASYVGDITRVIQDHESQMRSIYISEIGFPSRPDNEALQAQNLQTVFALMENDQNVALGLWFAIQDFRIEGNLQTYGLYREGALSPDNRKPAFGVYQTIAQKAPLHRSP